MTEIASEAIVIKTRNSRIRSRSSPDETGKFLTTRTVFIAVAILPEYGCGFGCVAGYSFQEMGQVVAICTNYNKDTTYGCILLCLPLGLLSRIHFSRYSFPNLLIKRFLSSLSLQFHAILIENLIIRPVNQKIMKLVLNRKVKKKHLKFRH